MAKTKTEINKNYILIVLVFVLLIFGTLALIKKRVHAPAIMPSTNHVITPEEALLVDVAVWYPSAPWTKPVEETQTTQYGTLKGEVMRATINSSTPSITHFEMVQALTEKGFVPDSTLAADGPGSSVWGYKKTQTNTTQLLLFSYQTTPSSSDPNEPLQFNCPCSVDITVFASNPFTSK